MLNNLLIYMTAQEAIEAIAQRVVQLQKMSASEQSPTKQEAEEPVSIREVCALLRVSRPTLHSWMAKGTIPFHRKGRRVFLFRSEVLASLEQPKRVGSGSTSTRGFHASPASSLRHA